MLMSPISKCSWWRKQGKTVLMSPKQVLSVVGGANRVLMSPKRVLSVVGGANRGKQVLMSPKQVLSVVGGANRGKRVLCRRSNRGKQVLMSPISKCSWRRKQGENRH